MAVTDKPLRPMHIAFRSNRQRVDAFHAAALAAGGTDNGAPGVRTDYHPHYYAAFVIDPEGNNIEVVCHDPPAAQKAARARRGAQARQEGAQASAQAGPQGGQGQQDQEAPLAAEGHAAAMSTRPIVAGALMAATIALPAGVSARPRPRFEPTDLEWEETGVAEVDLEFGAIRSPGPWRFVIPDFELDFGIHHNVELDLDGAYAIEGPDSGAFAFDHAVPDSLWPSLKIGIWDDHDYETKHARGDRDPDRAQAAGRPSLARHRRRGPAHGRWQPARRERGAQPGRVHRTGAGRASPTARSASRRASISRCSWTRRTGSSGPASWRRRTSSRRTPNQLHATTGITWSASPNLDLSVVGVFGFLAGDDRYGILFGIEPKLRMFEVAPRDKEGQ